MNAVCMNTIRLERGEFDYFRSKIFDLAGISLSDAKLDLLQARLRSRVNALALKDFKDYQTMLEKLPASHGEWEVFINMLTTNKTDWFREPEHFTFLVEDFLPRWMKLKKKHLSIWCAASSTGEEPYTLSLVLQKALKNTGVTYQITATDIDTKVLSLASNGVYSRDRLAQVPEEYQQGFSMGTGEIEKWMKVKKDIKAPVKFQQLNLTNGPFAMNEEFDLILCRNVLIYFNPQTIGKVVQSIFECASRDALLFIAHSESLQNLDNSWKYIKPSIYQKGKMF